MRGLPEAVSTRAVLVGVSEYDALEPLPAVLNNLPALAGALTGEQSWGLAPEHCTVVADPSSPRELLDPVAQAARDARDTLLVYFAGHGLTDDRGELFLGLPHSRHGLGYTGVPYSMLRSAIMAGRAQRHVIVLDCCFSGKALGLMGGSVADQAEIDGSYLLAAAPETGLALAPPGERYTAFTGELLEVLVRGIDGCGPWLDLESVYRQLRLVLGAKGRPLPQKRDRNAAGRLLLGRNLGYRPRAAGAGGPEEHWPDPDSVESAGDFVGALGEVRVASGLTMRAIGDRAQPAMSVSAVSALLNRETLPRTWTSTGTFLHACGLPADEVERWRLVWERVKEVPAAQPTAPGSPGRQPLPAPVTSRGWRARFTRRRDEAGER
ncbi:caspase domain-containing protein [Kitasatospora indigofera]|uniref:caspase family protein n=1 Tax=Kitasatospora indigofera TaxID=67307 RepID=UPI0036B9681C